MAGALLPACVGLRVSALLHAGKDCYTSCVKDVTAPFQALQDPFIRPQISHYCTFFRNRSVRGDVADSPLGVRNFPFTSYGTGAAVEQDALCCDGGKWKTVLDAGLGITMACRQVSPQHNCRKEDVHTQNRDDGS